VPDVLTVEHLKQLERDQNWAEIRRLSCSLPDDLAGDDLARWYLSSSTALEKSAAGPFEYRMALDQARAAVASAVRGGLMHTWSMARVAAYGADLGMYDLARESALSFLHQLPVHEEAHRIEPWARFALGRAYASPRYRRYGAAVAEYDRALAWAPEELAERITLAKVWALAQAGDVSAAAVALPETVTHTHIHSLLAAKAVVLAAAGDWSGAHQLARAAIAGYAVAPIFDVIEAAELSLILRRSAQVLGNAAEATGWALHTTALLRRWNAGLVHDLLPTLRPEGGTFFDAAASHRGSAGHDRCGLRGTVG
jgi:tetratricopeptide (TPR) repeat protein